MPISFNTAMASARTLVGCEPADHTRVSADTRVRAIPSASWLRAEFATHRNNSPRGRSD